jgi:ABC-2 type transport system ATP-binding protein
VVKADVDAFWQNTKNFLTEKSKQKKYLRDLSKGNMKKVGNHCTLIGNPEVVILTNHSANLDPTTVNRFKENHQDLSDNPNVTVLVSSHDFIHRRSL